MPTGVGIKCSMCGTDYDDAFKFCPNFGEPRLQSVQPTDTSSKLKAGALVRVTQTVHVDDKIAFNSGDIVVIQEIKPSPSNPEQKYLVASELLNKRIHVSGESLEMAPPAIVPRDAGRGYVQANTATCRYCLQPIDRNALACSHCGKSVHGGIRTWWKARTPASRSYIKLGVALTCLLILTIGVIVISLRTIESNHRFDSNRSKWDEYNSLMKDDPALQASESDIDRMLSEEQAHYETIKPVAIWVPLAVFVVVAVGSTVLIVHRKQKPTQ